MVANVQAPCALWQLIRWRTDGSLTLSYTPNSCDSSKPLLRHEPAPAARSPASATPGGGYLQIPGPAVSVVQWLQDTCIKSPRGFPVHVLLRSASACQNARPPLGIVLPRKLYLTSVLAVLSIYTLSPVFVPTDLFPVKYYGCHRGRLSQYSSGVGERYGPVCLSFIANCTRPKWLFLLWNEENVPPPNIQSQFLSFCKSCCTF